MTESQADPSEPTVTVTLPYHRWVDIGACMTHAFETGDDHPLMEFWAKALRALNEQVESAPHAA